MTNHNSLSNTENSQEEVIVPQSPDELEQLLRAAGVPVDQWRPENGVKTVAHLFREVQNGDSELVRARGNNGAEDSEAQQIYRATSVVWVDVYAYDSMGRRVVLKEDRRVFNDGRPDDSRPNLLASLAEKVQAHEDIHAAATRALREELGIKHVLPVIFGRSEYLPPESSRSYPGLVTRAPAHFFSLELPFDLYQPEGYAVSEYDKTTYFKWVPVEAEEYVAKR